MMALDPTRGTGGGGFMGGAGQPTPSSQTPSGDDTRKDRVNTLTPLTVFQVHTADTSNDDGISVDGQPLGQVMVVGVVRAVEVKATKISMTIEDHTGTIDVTKWSDGDDDDGSAASDTCREGVYVQVVGPVKKFQDKISINAFSILPVADSNQITAHLLDVLYTHLRFTKGALDEQGNPVGAIGVPLYNSGGGGAAGGTFNPGNGPAVGGDMYNRSAGATGGGIGGTPVQNSVLDVIKATMDESGINVNDICAQLSGQFSAPDIRDAIEWLSTEGHVYSTIDEDHFKSTDA